MAKSYTITNINANNDVTVQVTYNTLTKTFVLSDMPLDSKDSFEEALKAHVLAFIEGKKAESKANADASILINSAQSLT